MPTTNTPSPIQPEHHGAVRCAHLGVIRVVGEDAAQFLHGQLTHDFVLLDTQHARLASFCSPKGRMQASFVGFKRPDGEILLVCSRDLLPSTLKRLSMFVMRAKARLSDASDDCAVWGLVGSAVADKLPAAPWSLLHEADGSDWVRLYPAQGVERALRVAPIGAAPPEEPVLPMNDWLWLEVMSGVVGITQPIFEFFVPQMLNHESVDGVNFKKGCYPGQEIVARSQFRGTLKRRAYIVASDEPLTVGQEVFHASDAEQPCGSVAAAAPSPTGGWNAVVSMQVSAAMGGELHAGFAQGPQLTPLPLPYPLLADI
ncbi:folate-binding protein [Hydrogenophaga crassostreae]|uniref:Folate-binding protein n=1 Tax=Hydrogenophaga crassostreae TaxID=1763535 RepID=A0A167HQ90_9BURK|nr:folate-binding protein YgfZ [Hydrogenophaga crassostreae]AOW13306.1 folate-binding protein YgfZ [Hydrogenophaga crassostreae]OAD41587.1 folate-binding protein [Hydrogenophaga crassostreae]